LRRVHSAALRHRGEAAGRQFLAEGFSFSAEQDLWFALGFPHLVLLDDEDERDRNPAAAARDLLERFTWSTWMPPRTTARMCRVWGVDGFVHQRRGAGRSFTQQGAAALEDESPLDPAEAETWTRRLFENPPGFAHMSRAQLFCTEALVGPEVIVRGALAGMSGWTEASWLAPDGLRFSQMLDLGMVLWRLPAKQHAKARKQLHQLRPAAPIEPVELHFPPCAHQGLGLALDGAAAAKQLTLRGLGALGVGHYSHAFGDPEWVFEALRGFGSPAGADPDARRVFVAGERMFELELSWWARYQTPGAAQTIVQTYGAIRSPKTVDLMLSIFGKGKAKRAVKDWFVGHWDYAGPLVDQAKRRKATSADAKKLLAALDKS